MRPLNAMSKFLTEWARNGAVQCTVQHSGRIRTIVDYVGIALGWMGKGYQFDDRTFMQRMVSGAYYWKMAVAVATFRDLSMAHKEYAR